MSKIFRNNEMFSRIVAESNMYFSYKKTQKGKSKYGNEAIEFALDETYNLRELTNSLILEYYQFSGYSEFLVREPKVRIINAPFYKDKIVQVAINNVLKEVYYPCFIHDSYACIDDKGTHECAKRIQHFMRKAKWEYGDGTFIIKLDIRKFFYSINREILKLLLPKKIKCKKTLRLLFKIIDSADIIDLLGMPLGNTLSQICANIYMDVVDQYAKRVLGLKFYARYADDIFIAVESKEMAQEVMELLRVFIKESVQLDLNDKKSKIFPINQGVNGIGYKIYTTHMLLRNDSKKKIKRKIKAMPSLIESGQLTIEKAEQMLNSWKGHADYACSHNFIQGLLKKYKFLTLVPGKKKDKLIFKIDEDKLQIGSDLCVI